MWLLPVRLPSGSCVPNNKNHLSYWVCAAFAAAALKGGFTIKKKLTAFLLCALLFLTFSATAYADFGPKASVQISFTGIEEEIYYGTLLSEHRSTGPSSAWDGKTAYHHYRHGEEGKPIWEKFVSYEDEDGFYFLQEWWDCSESNQLLWTYRPPSVYKILLYFPESDSFLVSPIYEQYAFDSYYTVDLSDLSAPLAAQRSYDYTWELISLAARILLTILLELAVALLFGFREKRLLKFIAAANIATQVILNVALNIINYHAGSLAYVVGYVLLELIVFVVEAAVFSAMFRRFSEKEIKTGKIIFFALAANVLSFVLGYWLSLLIPGIF